MLAFVLLTLAVCATAKIEDPPVNFKNAPTKVYVTVSTNKVGSINEVEGQFRWDFYMYLAWRDNRQTAVAEGKKDFDTAVNFNPLPELMNRAEGELGDIACTCHAGPPKWVDSITPILTPAEKDDIWCSCTMHPQVTLDAELILKAYPYDEQSANIILESTTWQSQNLTWVPVAAVVPGLYPPGGKGSVAGWSIESASAATSVHNYTSLSETYSSLQMSLRLARIPDYYITRYVWGVGFLVAMALLVLFVPGDEPDRLGFVQSSFLGIVSWQFILVTSTPVTGYNTKLDNFMVIAMAVVFLAFFWNSIRIGFFDWLDKKNNHLLGDGEEEERPHADGGGGGGGGGGSAKVAPHDALPAAAEAGSTASAAQPPRKGGRRFVHPFFRTFFRKCGDDNLHWFLDSTMGVVLSALFIVASVGVLYSRPNVPKPV